MKTATKFGLLVSMFALLVACAPRQSEVVRVVDWDTTGWTGKTRIQLIRIWGEPTTVRRVDGGEELQYLTFEAVVHEVTKMPAATGPDRSPFEADNTGHITTFDVSAVERSPIARFRIDANGIIERYWISDDVKRGCQTDAHARCFSTW